MTRRHRRRARRRRGYTPVARQPAAISEPSQSRPALPFELVEPAPPAGSDGAPPPEAMPVAGTSLAGEELLYRAAQQAAQRGDAARAQAIYRELLVACPGHVDARGSFALLLDRLGQHDTALAELDLCLEHAPDDPGALIRRGTLRSSLGLFAQAETDLRHALRLDPASADGHLALGLVLSRKGLWREAIPHLRRVVEVDPSRATAWDALGEALNHMDDLDGALQAFQRSTELRPTNARALRGLGVVFDRLNRPREAALMYRRSRELAGT